jgi:hypothetical protein
VVVLTNLAPGVLAPIDVDALRTRFRSAAPFPHLAIDEFLVPEFAREVAAAYPTPELASRMGRTFSAVNERGKTQVTDPALFERPVKQLHEVLSSEAWLAAISEISGIPRLLADPRLIGGGMHLMRSGAHLDVHVDFNRIEDNGLFRRLNILVFFNEGWQDGWGGKLELWDADVRVKHHEFVPLINRCVVFETSEISFHGVAQVTCPPGTARRSFAAYYYTAEAPAAWDGTVHSTTFRTRPDEHFKRNVKMPIENAARAVERRIDRAKQFVKKIVRR